MASTVLPNGIIIPEKFSRDWYADLYHNWQELDNLLGGGTPKDGTLTIQKNGSTVGTFSANQATNETVNIEVPTKTSDLNNDSGFITGVAWDDVTNKPSFATVATSGSYTDLSDKPTIPTVNNATLTIQKNGTDVATFSANSSTNATANITVPTKTSDLTNDSGFITSDTTKIPLAGSNQISGSLIPATDNSIDIGSSTNNIKMLYTKDITIDGKTIDTDANGNITFNGNELLTSAIKESNFVDSGGQCLLYGDLLVQWGTISSLNLQFSITFPKPYSVYPIVIANYGDVVSYSTPCAVMAITKTNFEVAHSNSGAWRVNWIAIGR